MDDRIYTNLVVPAFIEPPYQNQPTIYQALHVEDVQTKTDSPKNNSCCSKDSATLRKVAYGVLLHTISGSVMMAVEFHSASVRIQ